ncbi:MAG: T9SS type A sorting domain-containing protein [Bacteroidetes bacterium]|nr:T9SS type A sorting domain-containing protein [Bacteroidota bacterium]
MVSVHFAPDPKKPTLFPNPADDVLSFQLSEILESTEVFIQIQDVNGRILMETKINYPSETGIDISGLQSGLYFIQVDEKFLDRFVKK